MKRTQPSFEDLLEPLYGSLLDPARFFDFAASLRAIFDSHLIALQTDDCTHRHRVHRHYSDAIPDVPDTAVASKDDASVNQYMLRGADGLVRTGTLDSTAMFAKGELERTAFYQDVLVPLDVHHSLGALLSTRNGEITALSISRGKRLPPFDQGDLRLLQRLRPHLCNVHALQQRLQYAHLLATGLDQHFEAAWILDKDGQVIHTNEAAQRTLGEKHCSLRMQNRRLSTAWKADRQPLQHAIDGTANGADGHRIRLMLHDSAGRPCAACTLHPLFPGGCDGWMLIQQPAALLLLTPFTSHHAVSTDLLRQAFELTPAEALLAQALLQHGSLAACRDALGKSHETLRTQLKALFAKTGTRRQSELVQLLQRVAG